MMVGDAFMWVLSGENGSEIICLPLLLIRFDWCRHGLQFMRGGCSCLVMSVGLQMGNPITDLPQMLALCVYCHAKVG
jgi:hypothetical protein